MTPMPTLTPDELLAMELAPYYANPLGFVMMAYPWQQPGTELEHEKGPEENQERFLIELGKQVAARAFNGTDPEMPILMTETSSHGTGKSVMGAWIADWILSTRPDSIGTVTAGTFTQLESRTWAAIQHWTQLCITGHWLHIPARSVFHKLPARVRIRRLPPLASELQSIDRARILAAQQRQVETFDDDPLIAGFDPSGGGTAWNVVRFRRGVDARSSPPIRIPGEQTRDRSAMLARLAAVMRDQRPACKVAVMFIDSAYGAPYVERLHVLGFANVVEVNFGAASRDRHQANMRAYMWNLAREWLQDGAIPDDDEKLVLDLGSPGAHIRSTGQLVLESKESMQKRGLASPDDGDALALTFAQPVAPLPPEEPEDEEEEFGRFGNGSSGWMR
jgi:hypothetical protein